MPETGLVVGGDSLIGESIAAALRRAGGSVYQTTRRASHSGIPFDLAKPDLRIFKDRRFDFVAFCAAVTSMAACEKSPDDTRKINVTGTLAAIRAAADAGAHIVFFSSSHVFDGEMPLAPEDAATNPKNVYGRQKLEVERAIENDKLPAVVLRVTKVLSGRPVGMFHDWYRNLTHSRDAVAAVNMTLAPVSAQSAANLAVQLGDERRTGIWHLSSSDELSYYDAALKMAEICGLPRSLVRGEHVTEEQVSGIFRHRYTALNAEKASKLLGVPIKPAAETLAELFGEFSRSALSSTT